MRIIVPISGGKDSQACMALAVDRVGASNVVGVHQHTNFDHSLTYTHLEYISKRYGVLIETTRSQKLTGVVNLMEVRNVIPGRNARQCTRELKIDPWLQWLKKQPDLDTLTVYMGMRTAESAQRADKYGALTNDEVFEMGDITPGVLKALRHVKVQLPIVNMTTSEVFDLLRARGDHVNPLYARGHKRVGCYPCLLAGATEFKLAAKDPEGRAHLEQVQKQVIRIQKQRPDVDLSDAIPHNIPKLLNTRNSDPFGFDDTDEDGGGCSFCAQ